MLPRIMLSMVMTLAVREGEERFFKPPSDNVITVKLRFLVNKIGGQQLKACHDSLIFLISFFFYAWWFFSTSTAKLYCTVQHFFLPPSPSLPSSVGRL